MKLLFPTLVLVMFGLCIFGAITTVIQTQNVLTGEASLSWPETSGTVTKWDLNTYEGGHNGYFHAILTCEYKYSVDGKEYTNNQVASYPLTDGSIYGLRSEKEGSALDVYYAPLNPKHSLLVRGWNCWMLVLGLAFFIGPMVLLFGLWKARKGILKQWKDWAWFSLPKGES